MAEERGKTIETVRAVIEKVRVRLFQNKELWTKSVNKNLIQASIDALNLAHTLLGTIVLEPEKEAELWEEEEEELLGGADAEPLY